MRLVLPNRADALHLSYCTNIHPGESLSDVRRALIEHTAVIAHQMHAGQPFGVGLRLSDRAARELEDRDACAAFAGLLSEHNLYVYTLNGFPYGAFHGAAVKQAVYRPDWRSDQRVQYTLRLARVLTELLPEGVNGSISTVPGGFRDDIMDDADRALVAAQLVRAAIALRTLAEQTGRHVLLALEPEPHCQIETLAEAIAFFEGFVFCRESIARVTNATGLTAQAAEGVLRAHLGVCLDVCHAAVEFEDVSEAVAALRRAGIAIGKVQLSNALRIARVDAAALEALRSFIDPVYLHQVVERGSDGLRRFLDLPDAIARQRAQPRNDVEWRVHFHIPLYAEPGGSLSSTAPVLRDALAALRQHAFTDHAEVETYTWDVLPAAMREGDVNASIVRELQFARGLLEGSTR